MHPNPVKSISHVHDISNITPYLEMTTRKAANLWQPLAFGPFMRDLLLHDRRDHYCTRRRPWRV